MSNNDLEVKVLITTKHLETLFRGVIAQAPLLLSWAAAHAAQGHVQPAGTPNGAVYIFWGCVMMAAGVAWIVANIGLAHWWAEKR